MNRGLSLIITRNEAMLGFYYGGKKMYKWMKEHKRQRNQVLLVGGVEICICILLFCWYAKINNWNVNNRELTATYDFSEIHSFGKKIFDIIKEISSLYVTIFGVSVVATLKKLFGNMGITQKNKYCIIAKNYDWADKCKLVLLSYAKLFVGFFEWSVPIYIFRLVVSAMEKIFELKKRISIMELNIFIFCLILAVVVICMSYLITKSLYSIVALLIYCLCILGLILGYFIATSRALYITITILSIIYSEIILNVFHKFDMVKRKGSLCLCICFISRDVISSVLLVGVILFNMKYIYIITYIIFAIILLVEFTYELYKNADYLHDVYITFTDENKRVKTRMGIREIGDMVMYTAPNKIDNWVNSKSIKNIRYSCQLSLLEKVQYRKIAGQHLIYADLNGIRVIADKYSIKNDWIYFYNIYNWEMRTNVYHLSDCIALCDKTKLTKTD